MFIVRDLGTAIALCVVTMADEPQPPCLPTRSQLGDVAEVGWFQPAAGAR